MGVSGRSGRPVSSQVGVMAAGTTVGAEGMKSSWVREVARLCEVDTSSNTD